MSKLVKAFTTSSKNGKAKPMHMSSDFLKMNFRSLPLSDHARYTIEVVIC